MFEVHHWYLKSQASLPPVAYTKVFFYCHISDGFYCHISDGFEKCHYLLSDWKFNLSNLFILLTRKSFPISWTLELIFDWYLKVPLNSGGGRLVGSLCVLCVLRPPWICSRQLCSEVIILFMVIIIVLISLKIIPTESRVRKFRQAPRLTIRRAIWFLASDTDTVFVNSTNAMHLQILRRQGCLYQYTISRVDNHRKAAAEKARKEEARLKHF